jgi:hypothetical protein
LPLSLAAAILVVLFAFSLAAANAVCFAAVAGIRDLLLVY